MQYMEGEQATQVLKGDFVSITVIVIVAPILKVVRNWLQTFHWVDLDSSIMVQISNDCTWVTKKPFVVLYRVISHQNPASFKSASEMQPALSDNHANIVSRLRTK